LKIQSGNLFLALFATILLATIPLACSGGDDDSTTAQSIDDDAQVDDTADDTGDDDTGDTWAQSNTKCRALANFLWECTDRDPPVIYDACDECPDCWAACFHEDLQEDQCSDIGECLRLSCGLVNEHTDDCGNPLS
jgi:hypothetical protein